MTEIKLKTANKLISNFDLSELYKDVYALDNYAVLVLNRKTDQEMLDIKKFLAEGAPAVVLIDDQPQISGYISKLKPYFDDETPCLQITVHTPIAKYIGQSCRQGQTFIGQKVSDIAASLCPNLTIEARHDRLLPKFVTSGFENYEEILSRLCAKTNLMIYSGNDGQLMIDEAAAYTGKVGYLKMGENILAVKPPETSRNGVILSGQLVLDDDVDIDAAICATLSLEGEKMEMVYADDVTQAALNEFLPKRRQAEITVPNWFDSQGRLLELNTWIGAAENWTETKGAYLINALVFRLDKGGYSAQVSLEAAS